MPENWSKIHLKDTNRLYLLYLSILYLRYSPTLHYTVLFITGTDPPPSRNQAAGSSGSLFPIKLALEK